MNQVILKLPISSANPARLRVVYVAMKIYYADLNGETNFNISMISDAVGLDDIVVTALNVKQKKGRSRFCCTGDFNRTDYEIG